MTLPKKLQAKLQFRKDANAFRILGGQHKRVDFSSNDYLGFAKDSSLYHQAHAYLTTHGFLENGTTGSRLLSGNHPLYTTLETQLASFYNSPTALVYPSGYTANLGFFSALLHRGDIVLYDALSHASIRDGIALGKAKSYKFKHNDLTHLRQLLLRVTATLDIEASLYVVTESVFSMDGDQPNLEAMIDLCDEFQAKLVVDEAHAVGPYAKGLVDRLNLGPRIFARMMTFGKGLGAHGAAILGNDDLKAYLVNFSRSFIYSTGMSPHTLATLICAHQKLSGPEQRQRLTDNISLFTTTAQALKLPFIPSESAIHCLVIPGNSRVKAVAHHLQEKGYDVRPILSPTVAKTTERLRFCLHSYTRPEEIEGVLHILNTLYKNL